MKQLTETKTKYNIEALSRGLEVLSLFTYEHSTLSFPQIVSFLKLSKSTVFRMLVTLESMHYVEQDPNTRLYRPGIRVIQLGFAAINSMEIRQIARPYLEKLSKRLDETVSLAVLDGFRTIYLDRIRNQSIVGVLLQIGSSLPAHCSALGKVLLADLPLDALDKLLSENELTGFTEKTITTPAALLKDLEDIRMRGYALGDEELAIGLRAVSAPIRDFSLKAVAAVNVTAQIQRMEGDRTNNEIIPALLDTVNTISLSLGFTRRQN